MSTTGSARAGAALRSTRGYTPRPRWGRRKCHGSRFSALALVVSLVAGAYFAADAITSPKHPLLAGLTLLPLFFSIRILRPTRAMLCGAVWGLSLFIFARWASGPAVGSGLSSVFLLTAVPAIYACLGAWLTRWMGFSAFVLGVGWMGVELALQPLGLHHGLLGATQDDGVLMHWVGRAFGYVLVAFLVAYVNALLVEVLGRIPLRLPRPSPITTSGDAFLSLKSQIVGRLSLVALQPAQPRAPPFYVVPCG